MARGVCCSAGWALHCDWKPNWLDMGRMPCLQAARSADGLAIRRDTAAMVCVRLVLGARPPSRHEAMARAKPGVRCQQSRSVEKTSPHRIPALSSRPMLGRWTHRPASCVSPARRRPLRLPRCASSTHAPGRILQGAHLGPTRDDDDYHTVRLRQDKQAKELPLPPLLDPLVLEQRSRFEQKKERPQVADFTPTQRRLWENPFGTTPHVLRSITS